jgi:hypothetical protein
MNKPWTDRDAIPVHVPEDMLYGNDWNFIGNSYVINGWNFEVR